MGTCKECVWKDTSTKFEDSEGVYYKCMLEKGLGPGGMSFHHKEDHSCKHFSDKPLIVEPTCIFEAQKFDNKELVFICSHCRATIFSCDYSHCPGCGAKVTEVKNDL